MSPSSEHVSTSAPPEPLCHHVPCLISRPRGFLQHSGVSDLAAGKQEEKPTEQMNCHTAGKRHCLESKTGTPRKQKNVKRMLFYGSPVLVTVLQHMHAKQKVNF